MLCQKCNKNRATVKISKNYNGNYSEKYLCTQCAKEDPDNINFNSESIFGNLYNFFSPDMTSLVCKNCDTSYDTFKKRGMLGCPSCYDSFSELLEPILRNTQGAIEHRGKVTGEKIKSEKEKSKIDILKEKLQIAISNENYEEAAILRDEIKEITE